MILVLDVGNTNITVGLFDDAKLAHNWRLTSKVTRTEDEIWIMLRMLADSVPVRLDAIDGIALGSVVPEVSDVISRLIDKHLPVPFVEVNSRIKTGIRIDYHNPDTVGADRICNAVAGFRKFGGPLVIVDFGTATTFDVISEDAIYLGGIIAPGLESTVSSLHRFAAKLPQVELRFPEHLVGKSTEESMQAGLMYGGADMVEGLIQRLRRELGDKTRFIATGGLASRLLPELPSVERVEPMLTLDGLYDIFMQNR